MELSDEAIEFYVKHGSKVPTIFSGMHLYPIDGKASLVGKTESAWYHRDAKWAEVIIGVDNDPANSDLISDWANTFWKEVHPLTMKASYINFLMEEGQERIKATYGENYKKLKIIKRKYDPTNFFKINQNIIPE